MKRSKSVEENSSKNTSHILSILLIEIIVGIFFTFGCLLLLLKLRNEILEKELTVFDNQVLRFFYSLRTPFLNQVMIFITAFGSQVIVVGGGVIWLYLLAKRHIKDAALFAFMLAMSIILNLAIKMIVQRPRPYFHPLVVENDYSFPSGHAMNSFVFYMTLSYLLFHITRNKVLSIVAFTVSSILILLIGISRVYLGVHYPSDVIAGYICGACWFVSVIVIERTLVFYRIFKKQHEAAN